ncbi:hypothetical protein ATE80_02945 [Streptomyces kanasensis]|uniref:Uncharacterized protein n=1 Tax=Streptomyces kanasensis TaxID=936756 RepID=A0A100Y9V0_9ACTN|nr:hypothetical protein ATE80_02945 [Streptomyces kanasensis]
MPRRPPGGRHRGRPAPGGTGGRTHVGPAGPRQWPARANNTADHPARDGLRPGPDRSPYGPARGGAPVVLPDGPAHRVTADGVRSRAAASRGVA